MSDNLGNLTIGVVAELAALTTGLQGATRSIDSFSNTATRGLGVVTQGFDGLIKVAGALGVAFSAQAVVGFAKSTTLAAESLNNLAATTGSTVEELSRLSNIAAVTGTDFGTFQGLLSKMTVGLAGVETASSASGKALAFLGVSAKDPAQALQDVADKLALYADGASKAAIARDLFGKSGPEFLDTLKKIAEAHDINATVTAEDARQATLLAEQVRLLGVQSTTFKDIVLRDVVPSLTAWIASLEDARKAGLGFWDSLSVGGAVSAGNIGGKIDELTGKIATLKTQLANVTPGTPAAMFSQSAIDDLKAYTAQLNVLIAARDRAIQQNVASMGFTGDARDLKLAQKPDLGYTGATEGADSATKAADAFIAALKEQVDTLGLSEVATKAYQASLLNLTAAQKSQVAQSLVSIAAYQNEQQVQKSLYESIDAGIKAYEDGLRESAKANDDATAAAQSLLDSLVAQNETFGEGELATQRYTIEQKLFAAELAGNAGAIDLYTKALIQLNEIQTKTVAADASKLADKNAADLARSYQRAADNIERSLENAFVDAFDTHGKSIAQDFAHWTEQLFAQLVLRPLLQPISAGIAGALTGGGGAAGAANTATSGLSGLSGLSGAGSLLGAGATSLFGAAAGGFGAAAGAGFSAGAATLGIASEAGVAAVGGIGSTLGALSAVAIPVIGWIAAAGALIYSLVQSGKDPSQVKGQFGVSSGTGGFEDAQSAASPFGNVGFLDAGTQQFSGQAAQSFNTLTTGMLDLFKQRETSAQVSQTATALQSTNFGSLEGTFTTEDFLNKYGSQVLAQVAKTAFEVLDPPLAHVVDLFKGDAQATATFVGGLLTLHDALGKLPATIAASLTAAADGTQATLDHLNVFAQSYLAVQDLMNADPSADAAKALAAQTATLADAFNTQLDATNALIAAADGTSESLTGMANAAVATYNALVAAIAQAQQFKQQIDQMFGDTIRSLTLQTLDNQGKYNFYQTDADALKQQLDVATDPAVIKALTSRINDDINAAFGLLSPDQQKALLPQYISNIAALNTESQTLLDKYTTDATDKLNTMLDDMRTKFDAVADKLGAAGDTQVAAANTQQAAANTPIKVDVSVDNNTSAVGG